MTNQINPKKLLLSKWTALQVQKKEKHFLVTKLHWKEEKPSELESVEIEAILTKKTKRIDWRELKNNLLWQQGWR